MFPPIVKVIVDVPTVDECVHVNSVSTVHIVNALIVVRFVPSLLVIEKFPTLIAPSAMLPVPFSVRPLNAMSCPVFVRTAPLFTVRLCEAVTVEVIVIVPPMTRL